MARHASARTLIAAAMAFGLLPVAAAAASASHGGMQDRAAMAGSSHDSHTMAGMDSDHDGRISRTEFAAAHDGKSERFAGIDSNGDGFISQAELDAHHAAMKPAKGDGETNATESEHAGHH